MAETLCQKRALEAFNLDPAKWGGICIDHMIIAKFKKCGARDCVYCHEFQQFAIWNFLLMFSNIL